MANLYPYINYKNTKEALAYYERVFGATDIFRMPVSAEQAKDFQMNEEEIADTTMHGGFSVLGTTIFCADSFQYEVVKGNQVSLMIDLNSEDEEAVKAADAFYVKLLDSDEVTIQMPYVEQFWGGKMGQFTDKYGVVWLLHSQPYSKLSK